MAVKGDVVPPVVLHFPDNAEMSGSYLAAVVARACAVRPALIVEEPLHETVDFVVVGEPGSGYGMRAQRDLEEGATILREVPLAVLQASTLDSDPCLREACEGDPIRAIHHLASREFSSLPLQKQRRWMGLADAFSDGPDKTPGNIIRSNAFADGDSGNSYLYELLSRANHSCAPTMSKRFEGNWHVATLRLLRPVTRHEFLTISYLSQDELERPASERRALLRNRFNFFCRCTRCVEEVDDAR